MQRPGPRQAPGWEAIALALVTVVGLGLRVAAVRQSLFADELSTWWIVSTNGLGGVVSTVYSNAEITPPLGFVADWLTTRIDLTPEMLRLPSLVAGVATIPVVASIGRRTIGREAGLLAAAFTALAPFMVYYSAEGRGYALMVALVALSTLAMLRAVESGRVAWWVAYAACSCAAVYTHYTSVFALAAQAIWLWWAHPELRRAAVLANLAAVAGYAPWIPGLIHDLHSPTTDILSALQPFDAEHVKLSLGHWSVGYPYASLAGLRKLPGLGALILLALAVLLALPGVVAARRRELSPGLVLVVMLALCAPVGEALFSAVGSTTLFSTRNLAPSWPGFALLLAAILMAAGPRLRLASAALAILSFGIGGFSLLETRFHRPNYDAAASYVEKHAAPGDVVIDRTAAISPGPLTHLDPAFHGPQRLIRAEAPSERGHPFNVFDRVVTTAEASRRAVAAARGGRIFLVTVNTRKPVPMGPYRRVLTHSYEGTQDVYVQVYVRR